VDESIRRAVDWAATQRGFLDQSSYRIGYQALRRLFDEYVRPDDYEKVVAGAYAVYGWMPTIMKNGIASEHWTTCRSALNSLRGAETWGTAAETFNETPEVLRLVNGSLVGTSKFLHFLNPACLPIWDSNISKVFDYVVDRTTSYLTYGQKVAEAIHEGIVYPERYIDFAGGSVSSARQLELLLFLYGRSLKQND
jgi:hypothetical protein